MCFTEAIRLDPKDAQMYHRRASAYQFKHTAQKDDYSDDKAISDYTAAIAINLKDARRIWRGSLYYCKGSCILLAHTTIAGSRAISTRQSPIIQRRFT